MFFRLLKTKKGFTVVELFTVVLILGILTAAAVPMFISGYKSQARKDCKSQRTVIEAQVEEAMYGMFDNGTMQYKRDSDGKLIVPKTVAINFSKVQSDHKAIYDADDIEGNSDDAYDGKECFVLIESQDIPGKIAFTMGDLRGGYRPSNLKEYEEGFVGGYYLKKKKLEIGLFIAQIIFTEPFYNFFLSLFNGHAVFFTAGAKHGLAAIAALLVQTICGISVRHGIPSFFQTSHILHHFFRSHNPNFEFFQPIAKLHKIGNGLRGGHELSVPRNGSCFG